MRHRKVLNLYDTEPSHEDLLIYLENIEGRMRQQQALLQMLMVGFRVIAFHESGDEAYYSVRNPDARAAKKIAAPRLPSSRPKREQPAIEAKAETIPKTPAHQQEPLMPTVETPFKEVNPVPIELPAAPPFQEPGHQEDEYDTLRILKLMGEVDN